MFLIWNDLHLLNFTADLELMAVLLELAVSRFFAFCFDHREEPFE